MSKRKIAETLSFDEKKRRLNPLKWSEDEVSVYIMSRCRLTAHVASSLKIPGKSLSFAAQLQLKGVPAERISDVRSALDELSDPLMPKVRVAL